MLVNQAAYLFTKGYGFVGARGVINVWNPRVNSPDEYTTAQIWIKNGPNDGFESIEAGWMVGSLNKTLTLFSNRYVKCIVLVTIFFSQDLVISFPLFLGQPKVI